VLLFASSREGEEAMFIDALKALGDAATAVQWLVVPRHPQRFDEVEQLAGQSGLCCFAAQPVGAEPPRSPARSGWRFAGRDALYYGLASAP
jgi:3-deoxy-D-manno-octulosonic-acid transferase